VDTKMILRVPWTPSADGQEAVFAYAKNLYTKEETAAEIMWEERYRGSENGKGPLETGENWERRENVGKETRKRELLTALLKHNTYTHIHRQAITVT